MNKFIPLTALLVILTVGSYYLNQNSKIDEFDQWKVDFNVELLQSEQPFRRMIFMKNLQMVQKHNSDSTQTYKMKINQFSIYTQKQFQARFLSEIAPSNLIIKDIQESYQPNIEVDWTTKHGVSPVKNQGQCGSCWSFSATGVSESYALIFKKTSHDLSQQQLVDCSGSYGNHGCNGGLIAGALRYIKDHGLQSQSQYPYIAVNQNCKKNGGTFRIPAIKQANGCSGIQNAISGRPVAVAVDARNWSHYSTGVFSNCGTSIDHAVLLVGVVTGHWKIKNSWGTSWGEKGFIRLASGNTCGICHTPGHFIQ